MKQHQKEEIQSRRHFLRQSACASLGVTGLVNCLANMRLMTAAMAQGGGGGYKALVCLFQSGGNDSNNMLVPMGDPGSDQLRADYEAARGILSLPTANLHAITPSTNKAFQRHHGGSGASIPPLGLHPACGDMKTLFDNGELAFLANVGTLSYPLANRDDYINGIVPVPPQLFSHSDQQVQWQSSVPDKPFTSGWGGRAADLLNASYNSNSKASMSISLDGVNSFQVGTAGGITQYAVNQDGAVSLEGYGTNYSGAYVDPDDHSQGYQINDTGRRLEAFEKIMNFTHENLLEDQYNRIVQRSRATEGIIGAALTAAAGSGVDFDSLFSLDASDPTNPTSELGGQMKMIARLIAGRTALGNDRQIFFCRIGGHDTHAGMLEAHNNLMDELSTALMQFRNALSAMGVFNDVLTFSMSDFNRTLLSNGTDANAGSDHAWGGHHIVMGGAKVNGGPLVGGDVYGHFPPLTTGGGLDSHSTRGRLIPETSVDQYGARLTEWMGAGSNEIEAIFPNLNRFDDPAGASANLGFI